MFTTLLVRNGVALDAAEHVARVVRSARELFGQGPAFDVELRVAELARRWDVARIRITAAPGANGEVAVEVEAEPLSMPPDPEPYVLAPVVLAGGLGPHKWRDRRLLTELEEVTGAVPLLVDLDGHVLEAAHANIFAAEGTTVVTPPLDGRILPGVMRSRLLAAASAAALEVREEPITLRRLVAADELFLTSSLRGVHPAQLVDGRQARFALGERLRATVR